MNPISTRFWIAAFALLALGTARVDAQQDGLIAYPNVYKVQFENPWVRLIRVKLPGNAQLADHTHPPGIMLHVYFNDADAVQFNHDGPPNDVTRAPVKARSYRVGFATPETHSVNNMGPGLSDYMRVELKTSGNAGQRARFPAPPLVNESTSAVEMATAQYRSTRITVAAGQSLELSAPTSVPALLLALTEGISVQPSGKDARALALGAEQFLEVTERTTVRNAGTAPVQMLRIDFLTSPMK